MSVPLKYKEFVQCTVDFADDNGSASYLSRLYDKFLWLK